MLLLIKTGRFSVSKIFENKLNEQFPQSAHLVSIKMEK